MTQRVIQPQRLPVIGVLISGRGSNLQALIDAIQLGSLPARIGIVISNRQEAPGLVRAAAAGIETRVLSHRGFATREAYDEALVEELRAHEVAMVCLAGFMRILTPTFCDAFPDRILNVHPSLLPDFPGVNAQAQALAAGARVSGATVHLVTPEMDAGPVIMQAAVPVRRDDTEDTLAARILREEHRLLPQAVALMAKRDFLIERNAVVLRHG